ncbi:DUF6307 family protein [Amycolatopsis sp. H20-H5]|uniref:DUF6307 family protein n=1 Tax=Amycolatopsis sp. H20-H5 TaxID=3046309 RepID=UPI002DB5EEE8|nr:DUF6307 family protein [Amycolatopsis sp. H20-H5]MEC3980151.1 DUF6307 family protein [Amycolatopsis sp. H20-H5]
MTADTHHVSRYEMRVDKVEAIVMEHSKLDKEAAHALAVHMVHAIDTVPESVR